MNFRPSAKELRDFGLLTGGVAVLLGVYYFFFKNINWISILILVGVILTLTGLFSPRLLLYPYYGWMFIGQKIGWLVNKIILAIFFFLILTPFALCRRIFNNDPLSLRWLSDVKTYYDDKKIASGKTLERIY